MATCDRIYMQPVLEPISKKDIIRIGRSYLDLTPGSEWENNPTELNNIAAIIRARRFRLQSDALVASFIISLS